MPFLLDLLIHPELRRPGLSFIASALLVELFVGVVHHPLGQWAPPAGLGGQAAVDGLPLGFAELPHQVRGFLASFGQASMHGLAATQCTACSLPVLQGLAQDGFEFLMRACNEEGFLEQVSGLAETKRKAQAVLAEMQDAEEDDF